jgi:hypothetical protein
MKQKRRYLVRLVASRNPFDGLSYSGCVTVDSHSRNSPSLPDNGGRIMAFRVQLTSNGTTFGGSQDHREPKLLKKKRSQLCRDVSKATFS